MMSSRAAQFLGISVKTLHRWHKNGKFLPDIIFNGYRLYNVGILERFKDGKPIERGDWIKMDNMEYYQSEFEKFLQQYGK